MRAFTEKTATYKLFSRLSTGPQQLHRAAHSLLSLQPQGSSLLLHTHAHSADFKNM